MDATDVLAAMGGAARWERLKGNVSRRQLARAVEHGDLQRKGQLYVLPDTGKATVAARSLRGVASHRSAARHHGFALPPCPPGEDVTLPPRSKRRDVPDDVRLHWHRVDDRDRSGDFTSPVVTVVFCLRDLPLREALSVGDSALACGVPFDELFERVAALRGPGSAIARTRLAMLDARSANAFESGCRAILLAAGITGFEPQVGIRHRRQWVGRVDLAHRTLRIVIECDGFETLGGRDAFVSDLVRHTSLVAAGWRPLRFTWEQVMFRSDWVLEVVRDTIAAAERHSSAIGSQRVS